MNWTDQTNQLLNTWSDAQRQLWSGWMGLAQQAGGAGPAGAMFDPTQLFRMMGGVDTWSGLRGGASDRVAGNILGTPDMMMRSINLLMKAWQTVAPQMEAGKGWQPDLQKLLDQWRQELISFPTRQAGSASDFAEMTKSLFEQWSPMTGPWLSMVGQAMSSGHPGAAFMGGTSGLNRMMGFEEGAFPLMTGMTGVGEMPRGTVMREKMGKFLKVADALTDLKKAQGEYHAAMADAMAKAVEQTMDHLAKLAEKDQPITNMRDLMRTWFGVADKTLNKVFTSPEFLAIQDRLTDALMGYKVKQREAMEIVYEGMDIPTRSEIDEAYRDIHALKQQVRQLKHALKEATGGATAKAPAKKPAATKKATS
jgi:class III poly(R)-hydroxyalkanoic acid synthase PhaE subunit